jgi:hypothetical protein
MAKTVIMLAGFIVLVGIAAGTPVASWLGTGNRRNLRHHGAAIGPVAAGRIFDVSGSYAIAIGVFAAIWVGAALAIFACLPLEQELARLHPGIDLETRGL